MTPQLEHLYKNWCRENKIPRRTDMKVFFQYVEDHYDEDWIDPDYIAPKVEPHPLALQSDLGLMNRQAYKTYAERFKNAHIKLTDANRIAWYEENKSHEQQGKT